MYKGDTLCLLPQEKEICVKIKTDKCITKTSTFTVDCSRLYLSRRYTKKGWRMFISRPLSKVYILTGTSKIMTDYICGNAVLSATSDVGSAHGEFYVCVPYQCTSVSSEENSKLPELNAGFKLIEAYKSKDDYTYITGKLTLYK